MVRMLHMLKKKQNTSTCSNRSGFITSTILACSYTLSHSTIILHVHACVDAKYKRMVAIAIKQHMQQLLYL